jgi:6-pyruvoyltetrahydropterin/6-carboxytetrahydropterin synthase
MPYRICKTFEIENGHILSKHPDNCRFPHGHSRTLEIVLEADELDANEMVCDLKLIKRAIAETIEAFDHAICVNTADPNYATLKKTYGERVVDFPNIDPTSEVMAKTFFDRVAANLARFAAEPAGPYPLSPKVRLVKVRLSETSSSWAEYSVE